MILHFIKLKVYLMVSPTYGVKVFLSLPVLNICDLIKMHSFGNKNEGPTLDLAIMPWESQYHFIVDG